MSSHKKKWLRVLGKILFILYIAFIIYFLLFSDFYGRTGTADYNYNLQPFKEIKRFWHYRRELGAYAVFSNLLGNVLIFLPFGFFLPMGSHVRSFLRTWLCSFLLSLGIETFQLLTRIGSFDVDDLLLNTLGGLLGYLLFLIANAVRRHYEHTGKK